MASERKLTVVLAGDAKGLTSALGSVDRQASGLGSKFKSLGKAVAIGAGLGVVAVAGLAKKSLDAFASFEKGMNEVFTLLPGISQGAMDKMGGQVKKFAGEFGVLPDKAIPALYQALSAGVPKDNVFEFLETAQKAARGGVTELETAVNGITGVVNAYGAEVITATAASDMMFTAVKLGKTTFEEMSSSLGDVTPIAAAFGVTFNEVAGALAASTAITGNTAKSVTGIKSLLAELGKEGQIAAKKFEKIAGKSFPKFIKSGGTLQKALKLMKKEADKTGTSIVDMFGGIEAGSAALQLAGSATFSSAVDEMGKSAGATQTAFETMNKGVSAAMDRIKAKVQVAFITIGSVLAPLVEKALIKLSDWWDKNGPGISAWFSEVGGSIKDTLAPWVDKLGKFISGTLLPALKGLAEWFADNETAVKALATLIGVTLVGALLAYAGSALVAAASSLVMLWPLWLVIAATGLLTLGTKKLIEKFDLLSKAQPVIQFFIDLAVKIVRVIDKVVELIKKLKEIAGAIPDIAGAIPGGGFLSGGIPLIGGLLKRGVGTVVRPVEGLRTPLNAAHGGIFKARSGGQIVRLAEAGQDEAVIPLPRGGLWDERPTVIHNFLVVDGQVLATAVHNAEALTARNSGGI